MDGAGGTGDAGTGGGACAGHDAVSEGFEAGKSDKSSSAAFAGAAFNVPVDKSSRAVVCGPALAGTATGAGADRGAVTGVGAGADGSGGGGDELGGTGEEEPRRGGGGFVNGTIPTAGRAAVRVSGKISGAGGTTSFSLVLSTPIEFIGGTVTTTSGGGGGDTTGTGEVSTPEFAAISVLKLFSGASSEVEEGASRTRLFPSVGTPLKLKWWEVFLFHSSHS